MRRAFYMFLALAEWENAAVALAPLYRRSHPVHVQYAV